MAAESIVLQLQEEAAGSATSNTELLRKALIVARKLRIDDFRDWLVKELNGYEAQPNGKNVPAYRKLSGELKALNPIRGWIPVMWKDAKLGKQASSASIIQSVPELEALVTPDRDGQLSIRMPHLDNIGDFPLPVHLFISPAALLGILSTVRNVILSWALDLEEQGILGQGIVFSVREKSVATTVHYEVNNYFGDGARAQIQQGTQNSQALDASGIDAADLAHLVAAIRSGIPQVGDQAVLLTKHLEVLEAQISASKPDKSKLRKTLEAVKDIFITAGAAAEVIDKVSDVLTQLQ